MDDLIREGSVWESVFVPGVPGHLPIVGCGNNTNNIYIDKVDTKTQLHIQLRLTTTTPHPRNILLASSNDMTIWHATLVIGERLKD